MDRKSISGIFANVIGNGVVVPTVLGMLKVPALVIACVAAMSIGLIFVWGHSAENVGWRKRVIPVIIMMIGALLLVGGALLYYRQTSDTGANKKPKAVEQIKIDTHNVYVSSEAKSQPNITPISNERVHQELTKARLLSERHLQGGAAARERPLMSDIKEDIRSKHAQIVSIVSDWVRSNDGIPTTDAEILDKATPYINQQLKVRGQKWKFDRDMRKLLGFPPAIGDSYAE